MFDKQKLTWMNNQYIKQLPLEKVVELALPHLQKEGLLPEELSEEQQAWATNLIGLYHDQMSFGAEIIELSSLFFNDDVAYNEEALEVLTGDQVPEVMAAFKAQLEALETFEPAEIKASIKAVQKETGHKGKNLFMPIRVVTTGQTHGPELADAISLIGKEKVIARVSKYAKQ